MPTLLHRLSRWSETDPQAVAQRFKKAGSWVDITAKEYMDRIFYLAVFLEARGITPKDAGCIFSPNQPAWAQIELATTLIGAKSAGIYPNSTPKDVAYILNHTEAKFISVANAAFFQKLTGESGKLPSQVKFVIALDGDTSYSPLAISFEDALKEGRSAADENKKLSDYLTRIDPHAGLFMIYTSGTTGNPKAALLIHDNLVYTTDLVAKHWMLKHGGGSMFSFLPLCHIAEKIQSTSGGIVLQYTVSFATTFDAVSVELPEVQPTLLLCVPRLWEKMMEGVNLKMAKAKGPKKILADWAFGVGAKVAKSRESGGLANPMDLAQLLVADKLVLSKIRQALGLEKCELAASGAAALPTHVTKWFHCLGVDIQEDYGQTETTGVVCMTDSGVESSGTVGRPLQGMEFKIAEDGEMLTRGRHVFVGYYKDPEATEKAFIRDSEGKWLATGDLAEFTNKGLVRIKGRKKEVLKTSGGKMVAPLPIEEKLKASSSISQVCMVGDGRKYLSALVTLSEPVMKSYPDVKTKTITDPKILSEVKSAVDTLNQSLASYEQIKRFAILAREFSIDDGEMTPTLKMKRNVIEQRYSDVIEQMYT